MTIRGVEVNGEATDVKFFGHGFWTVLPVILLGLGSMIGIPIAYRLWREAHEEEEEPVSDASRLSQLERAYYAGQMNEDEFRRIRALLGHSKPPTRPGGRGRVPEAVTPAPDDPPPTSPIDPPGPGPT